MHRPSTAEINKAKAEAEAATAEFTREENLRIVAGLKQQLVDGDYKVTKNSEWAAAQEALTGVIPSVTDEGWPYPPVALHAEREAIRVRIRELEEPVEQGGE